MEIAPILGKEKKPGARGRPLIPFRNVLDGIVYVLRTGCQWNALPKEYGSGSTAHRGFQKWVEEGVFEKMGQTPPEVRRRQGNQVVGSKPGGTRHHDLTLLKSQGNDL